MKTLFVKIALGIALLFSVPAWSTADFEQLTPCKNSAAFQKRSSSSIKKLENRLKYYTSESKEFASIEKQIEATKARFETYSNSSLLCGKEGLPRIIASGQWDHANEFVLPGIIFLYISGWIGWVGRSYLSYTRTTENPFEKEIILDVPVAIKTAASGFSWPLDAWKEFKTFLLLEDDDKISTSCR
jgi:photosystem I subunit 3